MAKLTDLEPASRRYIERYPFPELPAPVLTPLKSPLNQSKIALVTTAGLHRKEDKPFSTSFASSDCSYRIIPTSSSLDDLKVSHTSKEFDRAGVELDLNVVLPTAILEAMVDERKLGSVAKQHYSFMGSLPRTGKLRKSTAPEVANLMLAEEVNLALLTPV